MSQRVATMYDSLDAVSSAVLVTQENVITWANAAAAELTSYSVEALTGMALDELIPGKAGSAESILVTANSGRIPVRVNRKDTELGGTSVTVVTLLPLPTPAENPYTYRQALEDSVDSFFLLQAHYDAAGEVDDFIFVDVNAAGEALVAEKRERLIGQRMCERYPIYRTSGFIDRYFGVLKSGKVLDDEFEFVGPTGASNWFHHQVIPLGEQIAVFSRSITERKQMEQRLRDSENRYRALFHQSNDCVTLIGLDGRYLQVNQKFAETLGYSAEAMVGKHVLEFLPEHQAGSSNSRHAAILAGENNPLYVRVFKRRDGTEFLGEVDVTLVRDAQGTPLYIQSIIRDVTSRFETEKALRQSEERYRIISELIFDYAYSVRVELDGTMAHEWITDSFKRMTGFDYEEVDPATVGFALYHPDEEERINHARQRVLEGETVTDEYRIITKSGELRWMQIVRRPVWDDAEQRVVRMYAVAQDVTERRQAYEELRQSEEKYRLIAENANDMITRTSADGIRTYVSSVCRTLLGYEPEEMLGKHSAELIHPDDIEGARQAWTVLRESLNASTFVCRMRHKNGHYKWFEVVSKAIYDPDTQLIQEYVAVSRDISQRKQMDMILVEQERLRYELEKEQELNEVKSNLMRTISHEFRTPLALILTSTDFLDNYIDRMDAEKRKERLQAIRVQVKRLSEMLNDISFVVQGTLHSMSARRSVINMKSYCKTVLEDIQATVGVHHQFVYEAALETEQGVADKALLVRIVSNLLSNAVKYSAENSTITLRLFFQGDDAVIQVADEGIGIEPEDQKRIFEPFYRSNRVIDEVGGTGLGLSIVKDCVDLQGGSISVESEPGFGTTFTVRLPQTEENL